MPGCGPPCGRGEGPRTFPRRSRGATMAAPPKESDMRAYHHASASFAWRASTFKSPSDYILELTRAARALACTDERGFSLRRARRKARARVRGSSLGQGLRLAARPAGRGADARALHRRGLGSGIAIRPRLVAERAG